MPPTAPGLAYEAYHANLAGPLASLPKRRRWRNDHRHFGPPQSTYVADVRSEGGNSGYVFYDRGTPSRGLQLACVYDLKDLDNIVEVGQGNLEGDLDTITVW